MSHNLDGLDETSSSSEGTSDAEMCRTTEDSLQSDPDPNWGGESIPESHTRPKSEGDNL
jgi:hypothetical protein